MPVVAERPTAVVFDWKRWPNTDAFVDELIDSALEGNAFAAGLAKRMPGETGTKFKDWVDHLVVRGNSAAGHRLEAFGYQRQRSSYAVGFPCSLMPTGYFRASRWRR